MGIHPDPNSGKINITVSCDGSYTKRSYKSTYDSRFCISFIVESRTGYIIDCITIKKCNEPACRSSPAWTTVRCPKGYFHGSSKSLETAAAIMLFQNSVKADFPFRYTTLVCDGDSAVFKTLSEKNFYGDAFPLEKEECVYHYRKSVKRQLFNVFESLRVVEPYAAHRNKDYSKLEPSHFKAPANPFTKADIRKYQIRFANLFLYVIKKCTSERNFEKSPENIEYISNSVRAIPRHYMDHIHASAEERPAFHEFCTPSFCEYKRLSKVDQEKFKPKKNGEFYILERDLHGNVVSTQMNTIISKFDELGSRDNMSRVCRYLNQNVNESIHSCLFKMINKAKDFDEDHINFCMNLTKQIHNHGYEKVLGTWYAHLGEYFEEERDKLKKMDRERLRNSTAEHQALKKKSRERCKDVLENSMIQYNPGFMFEDYTSPDIVEFEDMMDENHEYRNPDQLRQEEP